MRKDPCFEEDDERERNETQVEKKAPIEYTTLFETAWFVLERNIHFVSTHRNAKLDN